jgi:hypothetical protein
VRGDGRRMGEGRGSSGLEVRAKVEGGDGVGYGPLVWIKVSSVSPNVLIVLSA